jgi:NAD(P)-dependent dehydrogenase (short-subunit alcohol dehydrogenase family)
MSDGIHGQGCSGPLAGGIGRGSALDFARRGAKVVVVDLDPTEREASAELVRSTVARAVRSRDVTKSGDVQNYIRQRWMLTARSTASSTMPVR